MDVAFTEENMTTSNVGKKRQKERLDDAQVDLVKRRLKFLIILFLYFSATRLFYLLY